MNPGHVANLMSIKQRGDIQTFLAEGKTRIIDICRGIDSLEVHTSMFVVLAMMQIGRILNEIHKILGNDRSKYSTWVKQNFGTQHIRYFQQSRQLVAMGDYAIRYSSLGKNRLLQINRLQNKARYGEILEQHPLPDITHDRKGNVFNEHMDAVVTLYNLREGGVDVADFDEAYILSCQHKHWIEKQTVKRIRDWLDTFPTREEKEEAFDNYVLNKMVLPSELESLVLGNPQSLNAILSNFILYYENHIKDNQMEWVNDVDAAILDKALIIMNTLSQAIATENQSASQDA